MVGAIGLEPTTPTMSRWCSNQLSYAPKFTYKYSLTSPGRAHTLHPGNNRQNLF